MLLIFYYQNVTCHIFKNCFKKLTQVCTQLIAIQTHRIIILITHMCSDVFFTNELFV
jgi:hypothetical protein